MPLTRREFIKVVVALTGITLTGVSLDPEPATAEEQAEKTPTKYMPVAMSRQCIAIDGNRIPLAGMDISFPSPVCYYDDDGYLECLPGNPSDWSIYARSDELLGPWVDDLIDKTVTAEFMVDDRVIASKPCFIASYESSVTGSLIILDGRVPMEASVS